MASAATRAYNGSPGAEPPAGSRVARSAHGKTGHPLPFLPSLFLFVPPLPFLSSPPPLPNLSLEVGPLNPARRFVGAAEIEFGAF